MQIGTQKGLCRGAGSRPSNCEFIKSKRKPRLPRRRGRRTKRPKARIVRRVGSSSALLVDAGWPRMRSWPHALNEGLHPVLLLRANDLCFRAEKSRDRRSRPVPDARCATSRERLAIVMACAPMLARSRRGRGECDAGGDRRKMRPPRMADPPHRSQGTTEPDGGCRDGATARCEDICNFSFSA